MLCCQEAARLLVREVHPSDKTGVLKYMHIRAKRCNNLKRPPSFLGGKVTKHFLEEGALEEEGGFKFQGKGNRMSQGRGEETRNDEAEAVLLACTGGKPNIRTKGRGVGRCHGAQVIAPAEGQPSVLTLQLSPGHCGRTGRGRWMGLKRNMCPPTLHKFVFLAVHDDGIPGWPPTKYI